MQKIAAFIVKKRKLLLVVMLILAVVCAALKPLVGVNTDMTKYLPDSSQMKIGMDHMSEAFPDVEETYTIRVMIRGQSSLVPSSTRMSSKSVKVCAKILSTHFSKYSCTLYTGTTTETHSPITISSQCTFL